MVNDFPCLLVVRLVLNPEARYSESAIHRERTACGPTPNAYYQQRPSQQDPLYGSMQSQSAFGSLSSRANSGATSTEYSLSRESTRSDMDDRDSRSLFAPLSRTSSQVDSYSNSGSASTPPIAIAARHSRRDSIDSMYGFARSPMADELRSRKYTDRC